MKNLFKVGDIIKIVNCADKGKFGYIYEVYDRHDKKDPIGYSVLTNTGQDLGGFSGKEATQFLEFVRHSNLPYEFENVTKLEQDRQVGYFSKVFDVKLGECSYPLKCQRAEHKQCDCACGGKNHGIQISLFNKQ